jgi:DNA-directed RNA polymerase specialized sigma24 family protein
VVIAAVWVLYMGSGSVVGRESPGINIADIDDFTCFVSGSEPRLRRALVAAYGHERGREAAAEALAYGWEHWSEIRDMSHPIAYLFRVGQSRTRPPKTPRLHGTALWSDPRVEPALGHALEQLSERQRVAVLLVHGFGWTMREVAELQGIRVTSVQNHLERGLAHLRGALEVRDDA